MRAAVAYGIAAESKIALCNLIFNIMSTAKTWFIYAFRYRTIFDIIPTISSVTRCFYLFLACVKNTFSHTYTINKCKWCALLTLSHQFNINIKFICSGRKIKFPSEYLHLRDDGYLNLSSMLLHLRGCLLHRISELVSFRLISSRIEADVQ